ncbi:vitamin B12-binding protein [Ligilactobacillus ruminis]|nr:vitamin B12-binding protein [Ligilactobacillus ruminis]
MPVTGGCLLRANPRNRHFARNRGQVFYGQISEIAVLPVINRIAARHKSDG